MYKISTIHTNVFIQIICLLTIWIWCKIVDPAWSDDFSVSGSIQRAAGSKLNAELKALGGCNPGKAKTTLGMTLKSEKFERFCLYVRSTAHEWHDAPTPLRSHSVIYFISELGQYYISCIEPLTGL